MASIQMLPEICRKRMQKEVEREPGWKETALALGTGAAVAAPLTRNAAVCSDTHRRGLLHDA